MTNAPNSPTDAPQSGPAGNDKNIAMLVWIGGIFFSFIPSLIVWLMNKDKPGWLTDQAREALNFHITFIIVAVAYVILCMTVVGLSMILILAPLVWISMKGAIKSRKGECYRWSARGLK